jgi:hypothetical protein
MMRLCNAFINVYKSKNKFKEKITKPIWLLLLILDMFICAKKIIKKLSNI